MSQLSLKTQITEDMRAATRAKEADRLGAIRLLQTTIKQREVNERVKLDDATVLAVIDRTLEQRKDSITTFEQASRDDLVAKEAAEVAVLQVYIPAQLSETKVDTAMCDAVARAGAAGPQDIGKVTSILKPTLTGRADMVQVLACMKAALTGA